MHKGIKANGAKTHNGALVIPLREGGELRSLQFIYQDGNKRFLSGGLVTGCYFSIGAVQGALALCIAEGFATGATLHEATGYPVAVAFNAGNLAGVARTIRALFPTLPLIICADDDALADGNPGLAKATDAAHAVGGLLACPSFEGDRPEWATDFNDMSKLYGLESVRCAINSVVVSVNESPTAYAEQWPEALPLSTKIASEPYPLDALPNTVRAAVDEVLNFTKASVPLVASSALAALSLAMQPHVDAKRAEKLLGPVGLFLLTIADSGERKSTCDSFFTRAIRDYEEVQYEAAKPDWKDYEAGTAAWEAKRGGIRERIRQLAKDNKPTGGMESALRDIENEKPKPPKVPRLLYSDATPEALAFGLAKQWPSAGVVSAEAGVVFGAHGMSKDSVMRNLTQLNVLWDGGNLTIDRRSVESFTVRGARLTVALQVQEATLRSFFERSGALARGTGFLARFLVAWPESTQGFRPFSEAPESWPALAAFNHRIAEILDRPVPIDDDGILTPQILPLTTAAKSEWVAFHDTIECELARGG